MMRTWAQASRASRKDVVDDKEVELIELELAALSAAEEAFPAMQVRVFGRAVAINEETVTLATLGMHAAVVTCATYVLITSIVCFHGGVGCPASADAVIGGATLRGGLMIDVAFALFAFAAARLYIHALNAWRARLIDREIMAVRRSTAVATDGGTPSGVVQLPRHMSAGVVRKLLTDRQEQRRVIESNFNVVMASIHASMPKIGITFNDVQYHVGKTLILRRATGALKAGRMTAVMGASGCGKTTLLNALAGKIKITGGSVQLSGLLTKTGALAASGMSTQLTPSTSGGEPASGSASTMRSLSRIIGFVPQVDVMLPMLTVREQFRFSAHLRLPRTVLRDDVEVFVGLVIEMLGLDHVQHTIVGDERIRGLSGGQKKRVNVGIELVGDPALLFLDEPTSGLDSTSAVELMNCLRAFAQHGVTIAAVIHQPRWSVFTAFDDLVLLRTGGTTEYVGPTLDMPLHFEQLGYVMPPNENPADFMMDIISGVVPRTGAVAPLMLAKLKGEGERLRRVLGATAVLAQASSASRSEPWQTVLRTRVRRMVKAVRKQFTYLGAEAAHKIQRERGKRQIASFPLQAWLFTRRAFTQERRDLATIIRNYSALFIAAMLLGTLNATNRLNADEANPIPSLLVQSRTAPGTPLDPAAQLAYASFLSQLSTVFATGYTLGTLAISISGVQSALDMFGAERVVFFRDFRVEPSISAYMLGKNIAALPLMALYPYVFLTCFYSIMVPIASFSDWMLVLICLQFSVEGLSQFISVTVTSNRQVVGGLAALVFCMFSGVFPEAENIPASVKGIRDLSFARYAMELLLLAEYHPYYHLPANATVTDDQSELVQTIELAKWTVLRNTSRVGVERFMDRYEFSLPYDPRGAFYTEEAKFAFRSLVGSGIVWRLLAFVALVLVHREKRR